VRRSGRSLPPAAIWLDGSWEDSPPRRSVRADEPRPARSVAERRTVVIHGRGAERDLDFTAAPSRHRSPRRAHPRSGFRPDRAAMWAVLLGLLLVVIAAASAHATLRTQLTLTRPAPALGSTPQLPAAIPRPRA